ncbi:MAG: shikimate kinase [Spirochaeta sp.]
MNSSNRGNLVLIGMPGAGKSTIGVLTAKALGMDFVDTDVIIQQAANRLLPEIIAEEGIEAFLDIEGDIIASLELENTVAATGGSAVLRPDALKEIGRNGKIVYLSVPLYEVERRVTNIADRGIAMSPDQSLREVFDERDPLYQSAADILVDCTNKDIEAIVHELAGIWHNT